MPPMSWYYLFAISLFVAAVIHMFRPLAWFEAIPFVFATMVVLKFMLPWGELHQLGWWSLLLLLWPMLIGLIGSTLHPPD